MAILQEVNLSFDQEALKRSMRFAFSSEITVVQELMQNGRRAGATHLRIECGKVADGEEFVRVMDDGSGFENFSALLENKARSGWDKGVKALEGPYGMGFLSALYSAKRVEVVSRGRVMRFNSEDVLDHRSAQVVAYNGEAPDGITTWVKLYGVNTEKIRQKIPAIAMGFPIPVFFDGKKLGRFAADNDQFVDCAAGRIKLADRFESSALAVYLQGFKVYQGSCHHLCDVVHLDSTRWFGKFPDRDHVVNEDEMLKEVNAERQRLHRERLLKMKASLAPLAFLRGAYGLALSLGMLEVFNDVPMIPMEWTSKFIDLPHDAEDEGDFLGGSLRHEDLTELDEGVLREDVEAGNVIVGHLESFCAGDDMGNSRRWMLAFAADALMLNVSLHQDHWIWQAMQIHEDLVVSVSPNEVMKTAKANRSRLSGFLHWDCDLVLCRSVTICGGGIERVLNRAFADEMESTIFITVKDSPMYVDQEVLQQLSSYWEDDVFEEDTLARDVTAVNSMVAEAFTDSPEERLGMALESALEDYTEVRNLMCTFSVDSDGKIKVSRIQPLPKSPESSSNDG